MFWYARAFREGADERNHFFKDPMFYPADVTRAFKQILEEPQFRINCMKLRCASRSQGGRRLAVQTVESAYLHSFVNPIDEEKMKKHFESYNADPHTI